MENEKMTPVEVEREYDEKREQIVKENRKDILDLDDEHRNFLVELKNNLIGGIKCLEKRSVESWEKMRKYVSEDTKEYAQIDVEIAKVHYDANISICQVLINFGVEITHHDYEHNRLVNNFERDEKLTALNKEHNEKMSNALYPIEDLPDDLNYIFNSIKTIANATATDEAELLKVIETIDGLQKMAKEQGLM